MVELLQSCCRLPAVRFHARSRDSVFPHVHCRLCCLSVGMRSACVPFVTRMFRPRCGQVDGVLLLSYRHEIFLVIVHARIALVKLVAHLQDADHVVVAAGFQRPLANVCWSHFHVVFHSCCSKIRQVMADSCFGPPSSWRELLDVGAYLLQYCNVGELCRECYLSLSHSVPSRFPYAGSCSIMVVALARHSSV